MRRTMYTVEFMLLCCCAAAAVADREHRMTGSTDFSVKPAIFHIFSSHAGMMNDPDGPFYDELHQRVHLFFGVYPLPGHGPAKDQGGFRFWQHVVSNDTVFWRRVPDAIVPDGSQCDATGAHSGSTSIINGEPTILYTGSLAAKPGSAPGSQGAQVQCMARPKDRNDPDLAEWVRTGPLALQPPQAGQRNFRDDTTAWSASLDGKQEWRVGVGASMNISGVTRGVVGVYRSPDFVNFDPEPVQIIHGVDSRLPSIRGTPPLPQMWECPDLFPVHADGIPEIWVLKFSADPGMRDYYVLGQMLTSFVNATQPALIDHGSSYYASKSFVDKLGRRILWAWVKEETSCPRSQHCSLQSLPRVVGVETLRVGPHDTQHLRFSPLPELAKLRNTASGQSVDLSSVRLAQDKLMLLPLQSLNMEVKVTILREQLARCSGEASLSLLVLRSKNGVEHTSIRLSNLEPGNNTLHGHPGSVTATVDRSKSAAREPFGSDGTTVAPPPAPPLTASCWLSPDSQTEPELTLHVFVDSTIVESFVNSGRVAMTTRVYPHNNDGTAALLAHGCDITVHVEAYTLRSIWVD